MTPAPSTTLCPTIIGGGPAGFHAAVQFAELGWRSRVIDESPAFGGAIYRAPSQPGLEQSMDAKTQGKVASYRALYARHEEQIEFLGGTQLLGPVDGAKTLGILSQGHFSSLTYDHLLVCTGCFERAQPFPGWTLPGVMTVGGLQLLVKQGGVRPCDSAVLVGTGPLLLIAARQLHNAGIEIQGVFESGRRLDLLKRIPGLLHGVDLLAEGMGCLAFLRQKGIPVHFGWGIVEARGDGELSEVVVAPYDRQWRPIRERAKSFQVSGAGIEYGFESRSELTRLLGLEHIEDEESGSLPMSDPWGRASKPGIYVAGDGVGVDGAQVAELQGRLAALACLLDAGALEEQEAHRLVSPLRRQIQRRQTFRRAFFDFSRRRRGLLELPSDDTLICRCEAVERRQIDQAIEQGARDLTTLKMVTRIGMGDCQGKMCGSFCAQYLRYKTGTRDVGHLSARFPLAPLPFSALAGQGEDR